MGTKYTSKFNLKMDKKTELRPYITVAEYGITFPADSLECLHFAKHVHVFYDDDNKVVAFQRCEGDVDSYPLCKISDGTQRFVRWGGHRHRDHIARMIDVKPTKQGIRLDGIYLEDEDMLIFELADYSK